MNVIKIGNVYKATRVTGPQHNFLGLVLSKTAVQTVIIEPLLVSEHENEVTRIDEQQLIDAVHRGVAEANQACGTQFRIERLQYVPTDTPDSAAYATLAKQIVKHASMDVHPPTHASTSSLDLP